MLGVLREMVGEGSGVGGDDTWVEDGALGASAAAPRARGMCPRPSSRGELRRLSRALSSLLWDRYFPLLVKV